jgi:hypothetical protein
VSVDWPTVTNTPFWGWPLVSPLIESSTTAEPPAVSFWDCPPDWLSIAVHGTLLGVAWVGFCVQLGLKVQPVTPEATRTAEPDAVSLAELVAVAVAACWHMIVLAMVSTPAIS